MAAPSRDESLDQALVRELKEEIGLKFEPAEARYFTRLTSVSLDLR